MAAKSIKLRLRVDENQILHRGPDAQPGRRQSPHAVNDVPHVQIPIPRHEAPHQPLDAAIMQCDLPGGGIETFVAAQGVLFYIEGDVQPGRERVGELDDAGGGNDRDEAGESGDGGGDDKRDGPVDGDESHPEDFAVLLGEGWGAEEFDGYVVVEHFGGVC